MVRKFKKGDLVQYVKGRKRRLTKQRETVPDGQKMIVDDPGPLVAGAGWVGATRLPGTLVDMVGCTFLGSDGEARFARFEEHELVASLL